MAKRPKKSFRASAAQTEIARSVVPVMVYEDSFLNGRQRVKRSAFTELFFAIGGHSVIGREDVMLLLFVLFNRGSWYRARSGCSSAASAATAYKGLRRVSRGLKIDCCSRLPLHGPLWISALKLLHVR